MPKLCPACGKSEQDGEFIASFCPGCAASRVRSYEAPREVSLRICAHCGRAFQAGKWEEFDDAKMQAFLAAQVKQRVPTTITVTSIEKVKGGRLATLSLVSKHFSKEIRKVIQITVSIDGNACDSCRRNSGGYHEAVIQLRGEREKCERFAIKLSKLIEENSYVSKVEDQKEGIDLLVGSKAVARQALAKAGKKYTSSGKLIGRRDGKDLIRASLCVRL